MEVVVKEAVIKEVAVKAVVVQEGIRVVVEEVKEVHNQARHNLL
jgi:hypothetical protein